MKDKYMGRMQTKFRGFAVILTLEVGTWVLCASRPHHTVVTSVFKILP